MVLTGATADMVSLGRKCSGVSLSEHEQAVGQRGSSCNVVGSTSARTIDCA